MILRYRSKNGSGRIEIDENDTLEQLWLKVGAAIGTRDIRIGVIRTGSIQGATTKSLGAKWGRDSTEMVQKLKALKLSHGDMLDVEVLTDPKAAAENTQANLNQSRPFATAIDEFLLTQSGEVARGRSSLCQHGPKGMCEYCTPYAPYDPEYLESQKIKHMSFHAYLRQTLDKNQTQPLGSTQYVPPLDEDDFALKQPCATGHPDYPLGICSKCQPSAVTLQQQQFRLIDYVEFETSALVEQLLQFWRRTGEQRFGVMLGRFEPYLEVPLGVKAVVAALYEPPQTCFADGITLVQPTEDLLSDSARELAKNLQLEVVGVIYSDCLDDGSGKGQVVCKRHGTSYFLSGGEALFVAEMQNRFPLLTKYSATGRFGSRFVTCVISGNAENQIDVFAYQVSNPGMAMVRDRIIEASVDPSVIRVRQPTNDRQYIPEVFFKHKNEYGIDVKQAAKPVFPVDYLLVSVAHGFPAQPQPTFKASEGFGIENRPEKQTLNSLNRLLNARSTPSLFARTLSDFHLLVFLREMAVFSAEEILGLCKLALLDPESAQVQNSLPQILKWTGWSTLALQVSSATEQSHASGASKAPKSWSCPHCTFINEGASSSCSVCGLPPN